MRLIHMGVLLWTTLTVCKKQAPSNPQSLFTMEKENITRNAFAKTLTSILSMRCIEILTHDQLSCPIFASELVKALDFTFRVADHSIKYAAFGSHFRDVLVSSRGVEYITFLRNESLNFNFKDLYKSTLKFTRNDRSEAVELIATFFQDLGDVPIQLEFGLSAFPEAEKNVYNLSQLISELNIQRVRDLYPARDLNNMSRRTLYHFYVTAFLAQKMAENSGNIKFSLFMPVLFNTIYEMAQIHDPSPRSDSLFRVAYYYIEKTFPPFDTFNKNTYESNVKDIYLGYRGALFGLRLDKQRTVDYDTFAKEFASSPLNWMRTLYRR